MDQRDNRATRSYERRVCRVAPYQRLAAYYDGLVGDALFPAIRDSFEHFRKARKVAFSSVADVGCGTGRFLEHLQRFDVPLIGVDGSRAALSVAQRRLRGGNVLLLNQDMKGLRLPRSVDLVTCNGDTLNYLLRYRELLRVLRRVHRHLNVRGRLVGDFLSGVPTAGIDGSDVCYRSDDGVVSIWRTTTWPVRRLTRVDVTFSDKSGLSSLPVREVHWQRWYLWREIRRALRQAGFSRCEVWAMPTADNSAANQAGRWLKFAAQRVV